MAANAVSAGVQLCETDCLVVIDMQNDFLSAQPNNPIPSPPFAVIP